MRVRSKEELDAVYAHLHQKERGLNTALREDERDLKTLNIKIGALATICELAPASASASFMKWSMAEHTKACKERSLAYATIADAKSCLDHIAYAKEFIRPNPCPSCDGSGRMSCLDSDACEVEIGVCATCCGTGIQKA